MGTRMLSFVIPVKNEQATLRELLDRIQAAVSGLGRTSEVVFIDDGSDDESWAVIRSLVDAHGGEVRGIRFRRNLGKAAALSAGFAAARGDVVLTLDADLQDDPREIGRFLAKLDEGYDIVSGWKKVRHDPWHKVIPSRFFNAMLSALSRTPLHDHNCGFKCYRRRVVKEVALYGEMHRMIPALGSIRGFRSTEIEVTHHPRRFGHSKYGITRFLRGFMDMFTVAFLQNYRERPLHLMGAMAVVLLLSGLSAIAVSFAPCVSSHGALALDVLGGAMLASAVPVVALGFLAELLVEKLHGVRAPLAIAEELPTTEVSIGAELTMFDGRPSSAREQVSLGPASGIEAKRLREQVA